MLPVLMGAAIFSVGFFMLIVGLLDLLGLGGLNFGLGERILLYAGGLFLCILGYLMARRLPRPLVPTEVIVQPPPTVVMPPGAVLPPGTILPPGTVVQQQQTTTEYQQTPPPESF
jgi:hypothetical protein